MNTSSQHCWWSESQLKVIRTNLVVCFNQESAQIFCAKKLAIFDTGHTTERCMLVELSKFDGCGTTGLKIATV